GQFFRINYQPKYASTWQIDGNYTYSKNKGLTDWNFDRPIFSNIIPIEKENDRYNFLDDLSSVSHKGKLNVKHFWVLNNINHFYPTGGVNFFFKNYIKYG